MKRNSPLSALSVVMLLVILMTFPPTRSFADEGKKPSKKEHSFKNANVVKVFPDALKRTIHVTARSGNEKDIDFLVFDVNGNMVLNYKMKAGEKRSISDLKRGSYMYHVFADDEYLTTGKIDFR